MNTIKILLRLREHALISLKIFDIAIIGIWIYQIFRFFCSRKNKKIIIQNIRFSIEKFDLGFGLIIESEAGSEVYFSLKGSLKLLLDFEIITDL